MGNLNMNEVNLDHNDLLEECSSELTIAEEILKEVKCKSSPTECSYTQGENQWCTVLKKCRNHSKF